MIWRAKHYVFLELVAFILLMIGFGIFSGIERWFAFGMAMIPASAIYLIIRKYPDSNTVISGDTNQNE